MRGRSYTSIKCLLKILEYIDRSQELKSLRRREGVFLRRVIYREIKNQLEDENRFHLKVIDLIRYILYLIISLINTSSQTCKRNQIDHYNNLDDKILDGTGRKILSEKYA